MARFFSLLIFVPLVLIGCSATENTSTTATSTSTSTSLGTSTSTAASSTSTSSTTTSTSTTSSTTTSTLAGCHIGAFVDGLGNTADFETLTGKNLAVNMWYINFDTAFPASDCTLANAYGAVPMLTWEPMPSASNTLEIIAAGTYDAYVATFAQAAKNWGNLVFLRFAHEMNGDWYPWDGYHNGEAAAPAKYIAAWRRLHDIFVQAGATNVRWVWSPNNQSHPGSTWNAAVNYYPGDAYVDWIGIDGYNFGQGDWQSFEQLFAAAYATFESYGKPLMISEFASADDLVLSKADWITDAFLQIRTNYQLLRIFVWFNKDKERDWRVNSSAPALAAYKTALNNSYFKENPPSGN